MNAEARLARSTELQTSQQDGNVTAHYAVGYGTASHELRDPIERIPSAQRSATVCLMGLMLRWLAVGSVEVASLTDKPDFCRAGNGGGGM